MNIKKKILFLVTQSEFGGAQRFIYRLITNLDLDKYDILVAAGPEGDNENGLLNLLQKQEIRIERLKYLRRSINLFFDLRVLFEIKKLFKKEKPDILFLCSSKAGFIGSWAGKSAGISKIIYRIGGWTFNDPWPEWKKKLYIWIERKSAKWKDYIINNAESDRQQAIRLGIKPKKEILTIYNGLDVSKLDFLSQEEAKRELSQYIHKTQNVKIVGTIANDYPAKGLKYLEEVKKNSKGKLHDIKFIVINGIPDAYKYLKAFDIFVLPSVKEGFPWVVLEAMAAEIPVIATRVGAVPEIIQDKENGILIEPRSPEAIIGAVKSLLNDKGLREKLGKEGRKTVIEKFNLEIMVKKYEDLF